MLAVKPQNAAATAARLCTLRAEHRLPVDHGRDEPSPASALCLAHPLRSFARCPTRRPRFARGVTVGCASPSVSTPQRSLCDRLLQAIGKVAWVEDEALLDPVTGSFRQRPRYVFLLAELLEQAAIEQGIPPDLARLLARQTVSGSGALLAAAPRMPPHCGSPSPAPAAPRPRLCRC